MRVRIPTLILIYPSILLNGAGWDALADQEQNPLPKIRYPIAGQHTPEQEQRIVIILLVGPPR